MIARVVYSLAWWLGAPLVAAYLLWRSRRQPEYRRHWAERWAYTPGRTALRPLIWLHCVSVGETRAAQPLLAALHAAHPRAELLLTHMTPTGRETGRGLIESMPGATIHQCYLPYDTAFAPGRFLDAWRPAIGLVLETEVWPNLFAACMRRGVPMTLVNARLSDRSLAKGRRWRALIEPALASLSLVTAQTRADADRLAVLGRGDVIVTGNLKFDIDAPAQALGLGAGWRARFGARPVVLLASSRDGEEEALLQAWRRWHERTGKAVADDAAAATLLVIVPRHPQRFDEVARSIERSGLHYARRTAFGADGAIADPSRVDVLLGDSMGEMFAYYGMADVAILGGSLGPFGGQNLIESCAAGVPVVLGPHTFNFAEAAEQAIAAGAALRVDDAPDAVDHALRLIRDGVTRRSMAAAASGFATMHRGATARTMQALAPLLAKLD